MTLCADLKSTYDLKVLYCMCVHYTALVDIIVGYTFLFIVTIRTASKITQFIQYKERMNVKFIIS